MIDRKLAVVNKEGLSRKHKDNCLPSSFDFDYNGIKLTIYGFDVICSILCLRSYMNFVLKLVGSIKKKGINNNLWKDFSSI